MATGVKIDLGFGRNRTDAVPHRGAIDGGRRRFLIAAVIVALLAVAGGAMLLMRGGKDAKPAGSAAARPTVSVMVPGRQPVAATVTATGLLAARREMPVGVAGEGGMVSRVLVDAGDWVRQGQVLATIDRSVQVQQTGQMAASITAAEAELRLAQANLDRAQRLVGRGFISRADIDSKTAARDAAAAKLRLARAQYGEMGARLSRLDIRAPASGLVLQRNVEPGQIVSSGSGMLVRIAKDGQIELRARLAEQDLAGLRVGMPAEVTPVGATRSFGGHIWQIAPVIDATTRQGEARIMLTYDPALRPGGFARATIAGAATEAPLLPESAVQSDAGGNYVYLVDRRNKVVRRAVKVGQVSDRGVAIASGLDGTERVVISAGPFLNPGDAVKPVVQAAR